MPEFGTYSLQPERLFQTCRERARDRDWQRLAESDFGMHNIQDSKAFVRLANLPFAPSAAGKIANADSHILFHDPRLRSVYPRQGVLFSTNSTSLALNARYPEIDLASGKGFS